MARYQQIRRFLVFFDNGYNVNPDELEHRIHRNVLFPQFYDQKSFSEWAGFNAIGPFGHPNCLGINQIYMILSMPIKCKIVIYSVLELYVIEQFTNRKHLYFCKNQFFLRLILVQNQQETLFFVGNSLIPHLIDRFRKYYEIWQSFKKD